MRRIGYQRKKLNNPFFSRNNGEKLGLKKRRLAIFSLGLFIFLGIYFFGHASYFKINTITVKSVEYIDGQEIEDLITDQLNERRWLIFKQSNIFFFSKKQAKKKIKQKYLLNDFKIRKKYFSQIEVDLQNNNSGLIWANTNNQYYVDLEGRIARLIDQNQLLVTSTEAGGNLIRSGVTSTQYPIVKDLSNREVNVGDLLLSEEVVTFIFELTSRLKSEVDFDIAYYEMNRPAAQDITLVTQEGWLIKFSLENSISSQIESLKVILRQRAGDRSNLDYIDLRFGEKVFWK